MFAKLIKHELRSTWKTQGIFSIAALGLSIPGSIIMRIVIYYGSQSDASPATQLAVSSLHTLLVFIFLALFIYVLGTGISLFVRFYKSRFTDEGYLTFTLPVRSSSIFLSFYINMLIWLVVAYVTAGLSVLIILLFGTGTDVLVNTEVFTGIGNFVESFTEIASYMDDPLYLPLTLVQLLVSFLYTPLIGMVCLTLGAVWAKKHKILAAIGVYYIISVITSILSSFLTVFLLLSSDSFTLSFSSLFSIFISVILGICGYFLSIHMMTNKLNLP